jgi:hypothetical protein
LLPMNRVEVEVYWFSALGRSPGNC